MKSGEWRVMPSFSRRARSVLRLRRFGWLSTQFFAANGAATADDLASGFGRHPGPKTVFASVFDLFWLVDSFWHSCSAIILSSCHILSEKSFCIHLLFLKSFRQGKTCFCSGILGVDKMWKTCRT